MKRLALVIALYLLPLEYLAAVGLDETRELAAQGDPWYQTELAFMYHQGKVLPRDYAMAITWYRKAADQGFARAQANLGVMYGEGQGVEKDYEAAAGWFQKAAIQGNSLAQHNLGLMYGRGQGVSQDCAESYIWESLAADSGNLDAAKNRDICANRLSQEQLKAAQRKKTLLFHKIQTRKSQK